MYRRLAGRCARVPRSEFLNLLLPGAGESGHDGRVAVRSAPELVRQRRVETRGRRRRRRRRVAGVVRVRVRVARFAPRPRGPFRRGRAGREGRGRGRGGRGRGGGGGGVEPAAGAGGGGGGRGGISGAVLVLALGVGQPGHRALLHEVAVPPPVKNLLLSLLLPLFFFFWVLLPFPMRPQPLLPRVLLLPLTRRREVDPLHLRIRLVVHVLHLGHSASPEGARGEGLRRGGGGGVQLRHHLLEQGRTPWKPLAHCRRDVLLRGRVTRSAAGLLPFVFRRNSLRTGAPRRRHDTLAGASRSAEAGKETVGGNIMEKSWF